MTTIAALITRRRDAILLRWQRLAPPESHGLNARQRFGLLPTFLDSLGEQIAGLSRHQLGLLARHTAWRLRHGYSRDAILSELAALGRCVAQELDPEAPELLALHIELELAAQAIDDQFARGASRLGQAQGRLDLARVPS